jgi:Baseplate J-like protein
LATPSVKSPTLDTRNSDEITKRARALAPYYVPEWDASEENGAGATLLKIAARLLEGIIQRLNDVPFNNFIAFLESIGIKLLPALPARAPITFFLSKGAKEAVAVPARSQVAAKPPEGGDPIIFETEKTILATPAKLLLVASVAPGADRLVNHDTRLVSNLTTEMFSEVEKNLQEHVLYLAHDDLFNVKGPAHFALTLSPTANLADLKPAPPNSVWAYCAGEKEIEVDGEKQKIPDWQPLVATNETSTIKLTKNDNNEIKQVKVNNLNSRWIRCLISGPLLSSDALARIKIHDLKIAAATQGVNPDAAVHNDLPLTLPPDSDSLMPFGPAPTLNSDGSIAGTRPREGDTFYLASQDAFSKRGCQIQIRIGNVPSEVMGADIRNVPPIKSEEIEALRKLGINTIPELMSLTGKKASETFLNKFGKTRLKELRAAAAKELRARIVAGGKGDRPTAALPQLSWEYWNGKGWLGLDGLNDTTDALRSPGLVTFECPQDIAPTKVIGQENFWIRARIAFGDYGQEKITLVTSGTPPVTTVTIDPSNIHPPEIKSLTIEYKSSGVAPQYCLTYNNLDWSAVSLPFESDTTFSPFVALDDTRDSFYLGFDQAPLKGPISIFFSLQEQEYVEENRPRVEWQYFRRVKGRPAGEWTRLAITDGTRDFTQSGTVEFIGPPDFAAVQRFGRLLFWVRAIDNQNKFKPKPKEEQTRRVRRVLIRPPASKLTLCDQEVESLTSFVAFPTPPSTTPPAPIIQGVYLNTAWSIQAETIQDEILGSSDGGANQKYSLIKSPVIEESIWINELSTLTETEQKNFREQQEFETRIRKDAEGNVTEFSIRWHSVDDLALAGPADRVYAIDRTFGLVTFGDGAKGGQVPPIGKDNIRASYRTGGGSRGNVARGLIKSLRSTIPFVEKASNPEAAGGGSDTELIEKALERGPQILKHRNRAVAAEDFEWLAKQASQAIARAKCLPTFDDRGRRKTGWVTVIIIPDSQDPRPLPAPQLRQRVEKYLLEHGPNVASFPKQIKVIPPAYVAIRVLADIYPLTIDLAPQVESDAISTLQKFLHPLTGGYGSVGWEFGRFPCLSDFYRLLEEIEGVDHVENLSLTLQPTTLLGEFTGTSLTVSEDHPVDVTAPPFALVYSGEHKITVKSPIPI